MIIDAKLTELEHLDDRAITAMLTARGIQISDHFYNAFCVKHKLARTVYYENQAAALTNTSVQLKSENKFVESAEAEISASKAKVKAAFYASIMGTINCLGGKFNYDFTWKEMSIADRLARRAANHPSGFILLERKGDASKVLSEAELNGTLGDIGSRLTAMLTNRSTPIAY